MHTDQKSSKVRNLSRNQNVAVAAYNGQDAVINWGKGRIIDSKEEFIERTQDHINKYKLKLAKDGKDSLRIPLFNQRVLCIIEVTSKRIIFW